MISLTDWLAIVLAASASFALGGLWYSPLLFLNPWLKDMGVSEQKSAHPAKVFGLAFVFSLIACIVMATFIGVGNGALPGALFGLKAGAGFVLCSFGINYQFANRSMRVLAIDGGYHSVQFILFGLILGAWPWS